MEVKHGLYKDLKSIVVKTERLTATFLPSQGGKLTSLVCSENGKDYMEQRKEVTYRRLGVDSIYTSAECAAYDDMFPTIDPWEIPDGPLKGAKYLDHGEVSRMPQLFTVRPEGVYTYMRSALLPYTFEKKITENSRGGLRIDYTATNTGDTDFDFIWAAHFMARAEKGGKVLSPFPDGAAAEIVFASDAGKYGVRNDKITLPFGKDGRTRVDESKGYDPQHGDAWKYYFSQSFPEGWLGYAYPSDGTKLMFHFDNRLVPYGGVWMNDGNGDLNNFFNAALEICTGSFDRPDTARARGQYSVLKAHSAYKWQLELDIGK